MTSKQINNLYNLLFHNLIILRPKKSSTFALIINKRYIIETENLQIISTFCLVKVMWVIDSYKSYLTAK